MDNFEEVVRRKLRITFSSELPNERTFVICSLSAEVCYESHEARRIFPPDKCAILEG